MYILFQKTNTENTEMKYVNMSDKFRGSSNFLDAFAKLQKSTIKFVMTFCPSVHPSVCTHGKSGSHWRDFHEILHLNIFLKYVQKIQILLKSERHDRYFT